MAGKRYRTPAHAPMPLRARIPAGALGAALVLAVARTFAADAPVALSGTLDGQAVVDTGNGPRQRPGALAALRLDGRAPSWLTFHAELRGYVGGPFEGGSGVGVFDFGDAFQNISPAVEAREAWAEVQWPRAALRAGIQTMAWGKLDGVPPTDVLNPRDYHDPIVRDLEERKIGVPALRGSYYPPEVPGWDLSDLGLTLIYIPFAVPSRLALIQERWFPSSTAPPARFVIPGSALAAAGLADEPLSFPVAFGTANDPPPRTLAAGGIAFRANGKWRGIDGDIYHYTGPETGPDLDLDTELTLRSVDPVRVSNVTHLVQRHDVIHMTGADAAIALGGFTIRAEGAYFEGRPYLAPASDLIRPDALPIRSIVVDLIRDGRAHVPLAPLFPRLDSVEWGIGADYLWHGFEPIVQVNQIVIIGSAPKLLIADPETRLLGTVRRRILSDRVELELRGVFAIERESWFVFPRVSWTPVDDLVLRIGYLAIGGPRESLLGQFRDNDELVLQARYSF